ncbi:MAG: acetylornithine deacetylase [Alphaproteobacteria bacterium]|nr:acetylornithine deacetylase [Alphaproteobacteria bacterium]
MADRLADAIEWLDRLVAFDTTSRESNLELIDVVRAYLAGLGVSSRLTHDDDGRKANLWATIGPDDRGGVVLSGHTDVVPVDGQDWSSDPFRMRRHNGRLYGRGTSDMKGFCAVVLACAPDMLARDLVVPLHFAFSYDEEVGCLGVRGLIRDVVENLPLPRAVIVGEPTSMGIIGGNKGARAYRTVVRGVPGHSSEPHRGANSIMVAARIISFIEDLQGELARNADRDCPFDPPYTTFDLGVIQGGTASNIIPEYTTIRWGFRGLPDEDQDGLEARVRDYISTEIDPKLKAVAPHAGVTMELLNSTPPLIPDTTSAAEQLIRHLTGLNESGTVAFGTEAGLFQQAGIPGVIFGPGSIQQAHQPDEFIEVSQMAACVHFLDRMIGWCASDAARSRP